MPYVTGSGSVFFHMETEPLPVFYNCDNPLNFVLSFYAFVDICFFRCYNIIYKQYCILSFII